MNIQAFSRTLCLLILLPFINNAIAEIQLTEHQLLNSIGRQLPLLHTDLKNSDDVNTNYAIGKQSHYQTDFDYRPTRFDNQQLSAIYDYYLTTKLRYSEQLSVLINTNLQVNQYTQYHAGGANNPNVDEYRWSPSATVAFLLDDHFLIGTEYQNKTPHLNAQSLGQTQALFFSWLPKKSFTLTGTYMESESNLSQPNWFFSGVFSY